MHSNKYFWSDIVCLVLFSSNDNSYIKVYIPFKMKCTKLYICEHNYSKEYSNNNKEINFLRKIILFISHILSLKINEQKFLGYHMELLKR